MTLAAPWYRGGELPNHHPALASAWEQRLGECYIDVVTRKTATPPYLESVKVLPERVESWSRFPFDLPFVTDLDIEFESAVTFFVGENGTGKSTLVQALAELSGLPVSGGSRNELSIRPGLDADAPLASALRPRFRTRPHDGYFFRAEHMAEFAGLLNARREDPDFLGDPYARYGGENLHTRSHGEAFFAVFGQFDEGLILMDEPESALSPQRQLALLAIMAQRCHEFRTQFLVATHSPILLTFPGAQLLSLDHQGVKPVHLEETSHYQVTRGILESPERYWRHLLGK